MAWGKHVLLLILIAVTFPGFVHSQVCNPDAISGPNLVVNPGFESGDVGFSTSIACSWNSTPCGSPCHNNTYSRPNEYYIGSSPSEVSPCGGRFQTGFVGSPHSGTKFMMIDGIGNTASTVWQQTVNVDPNSYYYFQVWISTIGTTPATRARLKFTIGNDTLPTVIDAPAATNVWVDYTSLWYSGATSGPITIRIIDIQPASNNNDQDDFGLDDIVFRKGCPPGAYVEQPELGPDLTFCGTTATSFTLDPNVTLGPGQSLSWSTGAADAGKSTIEVSTAGTYYVCLSQTGSCSKLDSITVSDKFTVNLGPDRQLCNPSSWTFDAGHSGPGVTYKWYKDGTPIIPGNQKTQYVNTSGNYKVVVNDPKCATESDSVTVTLTASAITPNNIDYCRQSNPDTTITFSVSPAGTNYDWYDVPTGGTVLSGGSNTSSFAKSGIIDGDTLYVQNKALTTYNNQGPVDVGSTSPGWGYGANDYNRQFDALVDMTLVSVEMKGEPHQGPCAGIGSGLSNSFTITLLKNGVSTGQSVSAQMNCGGAFLTIPLNFTIPADTGYVLAVTGGNGWFQRSTSVISRSAINIPDILSIKPSASAFQSNSGAFFNWVIEATTPCSRTPVMARDVCVLPVSLIRFKANVIDNDVILSWATGSEKDNERFEVQRLQELEKFVTIGSVKGNGNSKDVVHYSFIDRSAPKGPLYYRLKQVDYNGTENYSEIITVSNTSFQINLFPNPFTKSSYLLIMEDTRKEYYVSVADQWGRLLQDYRINSGEELDLGAGLDKGVYIVLVAGESETYRYVLVKY